MLTFIGSWKIVRLDILLIVNENEMCLTIWHWKVESLEFSKFKMFERCLICIKWEEVCKVCPIWADLATIRWPDGDTVLLYLIIFSLISPDQSQLCLCAANLTKCFHTEVLVKCYFILYGAFYDVINYILWWYVPFCFSLDPQLP